MAELLDIIPGNYRRIGAAILITTSVCACARAEEKGISTLLPPGAEAPSFSLPTLSGERQVLGVWCGKQLLKPYLNKIPHTVVISFWATYCKPCQKEIPELMKFAEKHKDDPIKIFCISLDKEGASVVAPFVKEKEYSLPVLLDPFKRTAERYGVKTLPALIVIGPDGIIRYASAGYKENVSLDNLLERAWDAAKQGKNLVVSASEMSGGESVEVREDATGGGQAVEVAPRDRWHAVARVECGENIKTVADELGVSSEEIKQWYAQLKEAALEMWKSKRK